jgi:hypothetical protein
MAGIGRADSVRSKAAIVMALGNAVCCFMVRALLIVWAGPGPEPEAGEYTSGAGAFLRIRRGKRGFGDG